MAQATNLVFFIPTSIVAIIYNIYKKRIDIKSNFSVVISGIIGAVFGSLISTNINAGNLRKYFGFFLLIIAANEIYSLVNKHIFCTQKTNNKIAK